MSRHRDWPGRNAIKTGATAEAAIPRCLQALCEHPFGTIKRWFGYTHFLLKGLEKVRCEWSLTTLVYNLKRVLNLVRFEKLMAAVGVKVPQRA